MENPFSAQPSKAPPPRKTPGPPPLEDSESIEPEMTAEAPLPPTQPEDELPAPPESVVVGAEFSESKFDLEDEDAEPTAFSVKPAVKAAPKPKLKAISQSQSTSAEVASHHQPTAFAAPEGWSDADFDSHDGSELPELSMEEKSCRMCKYFHFEGKERSDVLFGECRRSAPVGVGKAVWPSVLWESWCGEWYMGVGQEEIMQMARSVADSVKDG